MFLACYVIIGITCIISFVTFNDSLKYSRYLFNAYIINHNREWHRFFTYALIHADYMHLLVNMYSLYLFGQIVEISFYNFFGHSRGLFYFVLMYVGAAMLSTYPSFEKNKTNPYYNAVGASGCVSAVVFSAVLIYPTMPLSFIFFPFIHIPAFILGAAYLVYSWYMGKKGKDNIGHDAHFWGAVFGVVFTVCLKFSLLANFTEQIQFYVFSLING